MVEHVVGLSQKENQPMFSGNINLPEDRMKFFITVGPVVHSDLERQICKNDIDYWFKEIFEKGLPHGRDDYGSAQAGARQWIARKCFMLEQITWKSLDGKTSWEFRGYGGDPYHYGTSTDTWFNFNLGVGEFMMGFGFDQGPVIEEGHCTKIDPPK